MIRDGTVEDASEIARIQVQTWRVAYAGIAPADYLAALSEEKRTLSWQQQLTDGRSLILVAFENNEMAGWISGGRCRDADAPDASEVYAIYVSPPYWGRHIGRQLMAKFEEQLPATSPVYLWVLGANQRALTFYDKMGYTPDGTAKDIKLGRATLSEIRLVKKRTGPAGVHSSPKTHPSQSPRS